MPAGFWGVRYLGHNCCAASNSFRLKAPSPTNEQRNSNYCCAVPNTRYRRHALLNRGRRLGTLGWRSRVRRPHPWLVTTDREARSPPAPDEGAAFNGWTGLDERQRECCPDNVRCKPPVQAKKSRRPCKKPPQWSAGRRACRSNGTRHRKVQTREGASFGAPLPSRACEGQRKGRRRPAPHSQRGR